LSDFRWYKDVFLSKVLIRPDNAEAFWKEKFISGLPHYFAYKVREKLFEKGHTDYAQTTYGEIICTIQKVGLNLCNDLRMTHQLEKERKYAKLELGNFCEQFGYSPLILLPHLDKEENNKSFTKIIIKIIIVTKEINLTSFIITNLTKIITLSHKLKMLEDKKIELLFVIDVVKLVIFKRIVKSRKKLIK
jgi:hypothetical protein